MAEDLLEASSPLSPMITKVDVNVFVGLDFSEPTVNRYQPTPWGFAFLRL